MSSRSVPVVVTLMLSVLLHLTVPGVNRGHGVGVGITHASIEVLPHAMFSRPLVLPVFNLPQSCQMLGKLLGPQVELKSSELITNLV